MDMDKIIKKLRYEKQNIVDGELTGYKPTSNKEIIDKINEIIDVINKER